MRVRLWIKAENMEQCREVCAAKGVEIVKEVAALHHTSHMLVDAEASRTLIVEWYGAPPPSRPSPYPVGSLLYYRFAEPGETL